MNRITTYSFLILLLVWTGCAKMGAPPGGPEDRLAPEILSTIPESGTTNVDVNTTITIEFDEGVRETTLLKAFALSPLPLGEVRAKWKRNKLILEFSEPLVDDKTYVLTLGTDLSDRRGNQLKDAFILPFSTGDKLDKGYVQGILKADGNAGGFTIIGFYLGKELVTDVTSSTTDPDPSRIIPDAMTQTSADGTWNLTNLKDGYWRVFAYKDVDNDRLWTPWLEALGIPSYDVEVLEDSTFTPRELFLVSSDPVILPFPQKASSRLKDRFEVKFDRKPAKLSWGFNLVEAPDTIDLAEHEGYQVKDLDIKPSLIDFKPGDSTVVLVEWNRQLEGTEAWLAIKGAFGTTEMLDTTLYVNLQNSSTIDSFPPLLVYQNPAEDKRLHDFKPEIEFTFNEPMSEDLGNGLQIVTSGDTILPDYSWTKSNILHLDMTPYSIDGRFVVKLFGDSLKDVFGNSLADSLLSFNYTKLPEDSLGSITGRVMNPGGDYKIHVIATSVSERELPLETVADSNHTYIFEGLPQGYWRLEAWKDLSKNNYHYGGNTFPYVPSDPYVISRDTIYVRARWESGSTEIIFP